MPLLQRTGSAKSTLSMMQRKATRYQKYLTLASVILIVTSTIVIFSSVILMKFYHLPTLVFWSSFFYYTPYLMVSLGVYMLVISIYGFAITGTENRGVLAVFAVLLCLAFVGQLASIFTAIQTQTVIKLDQSVGSNYIGTLKEYGRDPWVTAHWDALQQDMRCCGAKGKNSGHTDYKNAPLKGDQTGNSLPDSCCVTVKKGCGKDVLEHSSASSTLMDTIWVIGCLDALEYRLKNDVTTMMGVYAGVGVAIALIELIAVVLTSAFIAQITRRRLREEMMWNSVRNADDMDHKEAARALNPSVEHETVC